MPTGGVEPTVENLSAWFKAGVTCVGMGSQLITKEILESQDYQKLTDSVNKAMKIVEGFRK